MNVEKWLSENTQDLSGKTVAITGSTGGLGRELCRMLALLGASLILLDRNAGRSGAHRQELISNYGISVECVNVDMENIDTVITATELLKQRNIDVFIHNAGAYSIPRRKCSTGYNNIFQINFASPTFMIRELLPYLRRRRGRVVVVGSIAHNYSKTDVGDVDFSTRKRASRIYGNAKRYLMFSLYELFKTENEATLSVTHPGITFTNITAHYPKLIFAIIKYPMKVIFMKPQKAALSILKGVFQSTGECEWIGPEFFNIWGLPKKTEIKTCGPAERRKIAKVAEEVYKSCKQQNKSECF